jgi:hypothetical protein
VVVIIIMTFGVFEEIERLIEYIPIEYQDDDDNNKNNLQGTEAKFAKGVSIDTKFYFEDIDGVATRLGIIDIAARRKHTVVSFRDIVKLFNKFLKDATLEELINKQRYKQLQQAINGGSTLPLGILLFDFSLAALEGDTLDAKLYLTHSLYLLGLHKRLYIILSVIVNELSSLREDRNVRELLTSIALITEPYNIDIYFDPKSDVFNKRYSIYLEELQKLAPVYSTQVKVSV